MSQGDGTTRIDAEWEKLVDLLGEEAAKKLIKNFNVYPMWARIGTVVPIRGELVGDFYPLGSQARPLPRRIRTTDVTE